jgi:hypothetical protein
MFCWVVVNDFHVPRCKLAYLSFVLSLNNNNPREKEKEGQKSSLQKNIVKLRGIP